MKRIIILQIAFILFLCYTSQTLSYEKKSLSKDKVKSIQIQMSNLCIQAVESMTDYIMTKSPGYFEEAKKKFVITDSILSFLQTCCTSVTDTSTIRSLKSASEMVSKLTIQEIEDLANKEEKANFNFGGRTALLSKDGEAPFLIYLSVVKNMAQNLIDKLSTIYFTNTWYFPKGTFKMRAYLDRKWQEKLDRVGLGDEFVAVTFQMTNNSGKDIDFNTFTEKFTILSTDGKQHENIEPGFDDILALGDLPEDDKQIIFDKVITIYDGANTPIVVLFPIKVLPVDSWLRIVFDTSLGELTGSLTKGKLTREQ